MEILSAKETALKQDPPLQSRDRGDPLQTAQFMMFVQYMHQRNIHRNSTSRIASVASFIKLTLQKQVNKNRSLSREKTGSAKRLKARARGGKNGGTLPKPCQDARIKGCFLLKQSTFARLYC